jgi:diacylglycerol O-acyltransferase
MPCSMGFQVLFHAPDTILNQPITGARRFVADSFSLSRMKKLAKASMRA